MSELSLIIRMFFILLNSLGLILIIIVASKTLSSKLIKFYRGLKNEWRKSR